MNTVPVRGARKGRCCHGPQGGHMTQDSLKLGYIDALRGYAILAVVLVHSSHNVAPAAGGVQWLMSQGAKGVQLFYIASALTLCMSWTFRASREAAPLRNFFIRRFFRIAPLFYLAIAFYTVMYGLGPRYWAPNGIEWWFIPLTALFAHGFHPETITSVVPGGWSIAVEMNFYLILPFLLMLFRKDIWFFAFFPVTLVMYVLFKLFCDQFISPLYPADQQYLVYGFSIFNFISQLPVFALGMITWRLLENPHYLQWLGRRKLWVGLVVIGGIVAVALLPDGIRRRLVEHHVTFGLLFCAFAVLLARHPVRILVNPLVTFFGKVSFSMYLVHFAVLDLFKRAGVDQLFGQGTFASIAHYGVVVAATAGVSYVTYVTIEKTGIGWGRKLIDRLESGRQPPPAPSGW